MFPKPLILGPIVSLSCALLLSGCEKVTTPFGTGFSVTYDGNGATSGSLPTSLANRTVGSSISLDSPSGLVKIQVGGVSARFAGWNSAADGSGTTYGATLTMPSNDVRLYAKWVPYQQGDTGPGGGLIYHVAADYASGWRYLEAAPADCTSNGNGGTDFSYQTPSGATSDVVTTGSALGTGWSNTLEIVATNASFGLSNMAAQRARTWTAGGQTDWFLPSYVETAVMYTNLHLSNLGGFNAGLYWTSTDTVDNDTVNAINFSTGGLTAVTFSQPLVRVRAIRRF